MQHLNIRGALTSVCALVAVTAPASAQTIYTDRTAFLAATTNQAVSDFSNLSAGSGYGSLYSGTDFTISTSSGLFIANAPNGIPNYEFNSGKTLSVVKFSDPTAVFTPGAGVTAFGFDYGVLAGTNTSVTINGTSYTASGQQALNFFGIVGPTGVSPISFGFAASRAIFDNVTVASAAPVVEPPPVASAVPEPACWAMMIAGFGTIGGSLRRRQRVSVRFA